MGLALSEAWPGGRSETGQTRRGSRKERRPELSTVQGQERLREQCSKRNPNPTQSVRPFLSCLVRKDQGERREAASPGNGKKLRWRAVSGTESGPRGQGFGQLNKPGEGPCSAWLPPLCHLEQITGAEAITGQPDGLSRCIKLFKASPLLLL